MGASDTHALAAAQIDRYLMERALRQEGRGTAPAAGVRPAITISRAAGIPGEGIGALVARELGFHFIDRQVLDAVLEDTRLGEKIIQSLDTGCLSAVDAWFAGLVNYDRRVVDVRSFHHMVSRVVRGISLCGNAVILGRGANFILRDTDAFKVRVTAPLNLRAQAVVAAAGGAQAMSLVEARRRITDHYELRRHFVATHFRAEIDDPEAYDAIFSLRRIDAEYAARLILDAYAAATA